MRDELNLIELTDRYLRGELNATDRAAFEERMGTNAELREVVEDQRALHGGIKRLALRPAVNKAYRSYKFGKWAPGIGGAAVIAILALGGWMMAKDGGHLTEMTSDPSEQVEQLLTLSDTTGTGLPALVMTIDPKADTTLITPNGLVLDIPRGAFVDEAGRAITKPVRITLLEAIDGVDIMKAGLSTMSGDTLLETGGMFYIDAQVDGERVGIDPAKPLTVMVPAETGPTTRSQEIPEVRVRHILLGTSGSNSDLVLKARADSLLAVLERDRSKFPALAAQFSDDPKSRTTGGVYDWFDRNTMMPEFTAASFGQKVGAITIAKTQYGYHIVEVLGQRTRAVGPPAHDNEMMLYEGVMTEEGVVDWRNPQPLARTLVPVDITTLDFYPPGYLAKVAELGKDATDKEYTDSLYWSFSGVTLGEDDWVKIRQGIAGASNQRKVLDSLQSKGYEVLSNSDGSTSINAPGLIDPAKVEAIWNERFNGSNLATREFEERMLEIHRTCDNQVLDLYANNLEKTLSQLDSMAVRMGHGAFASFALRNDGRVVLPEHAAERLRNVYTEWSQRYAEVARKTQEGFYRKEGQADQQAYQRQVDRQMKDLQQDSERFGKEFNANLRSVYDQLGYPMPPPAPPRAAFAVPITNAGWWNVDKAVLAATTSRSSMSYTDDQSGKTATLTYTPVTIDVADKESFSELRVYLIPKELNSYQRLMETNGVFTEKLNALFQYDLICMGRKDGQLYAASRQDLSTSGSITLSMAPTDEESLRRMVRTPQVTTSLVNDLVEQARHMEWLELEAKRNQAKAKQEEFRNALMAVVFPCMRPSPAAIRPSRVLQEAQPDTLGMPVTGMAVTMEPVFPGGEDALNQYLLKTTKLPVVISGNGRVLVEFTVQTDGSIANVTVTRSGGVEADQEALRVISSMPTPWTPGRSNGQPVAMTYRIPFNFKLQ